MELSANVVGYLEPCDGQGADVLLILSLEGTEDRV